MIFQKSITLESEAQDQDAYEQQAGEGRLHTYSIHIATTALSAYFPAADSKIPTSLFTSEIAIRVQHHVAKTAL